MSIKKENPAQREAFLIYSRMDKRSVQKLADNWQKYSKKKRPSYSTLKQWSQYYKWLDRVKAIDDKANAAVDEQATKLLVDDLTKLREVKNSIFQKLLTRIFGGKDKEGNKIEPNELEIKELATILNLTKTELGEPTSITKGEMRTTDESSKKVADALAKLTELADE